MPTSKREVLHPEKPRKITDLVGKEVTIWINCDPLLGDLHHIEKATLNYVARYWIGFSRIYRKRVIRDHVPIMNVLKLTEYQRTTHRRDD